MNVRRTLILSLVGTALVAGLGVTAPAFAYDEPNNAPRGHAAGALECRRCHRADETNGFCTECHRPHGGTGQTARKGPHGLYTSTTDRCDACHSVHDSGGAKLLAAVTVTDSCYSCHDGTGGRGVYGSLAARGISEESSHSIDATNAVPGGDGSTGGATTMAFKGLGGNLGCNDCHSPHDANTVAAYTSDRHRSDSSIRLSTKTYDSIPSDHLLRRNPGGSTATATVYGSDWCLACHAGRASGGTPHNHPVDSLVVTTTPFDYSSVAILASDGPTTSTVIGAMAFSNRGFLMPYPRTPSQGDHLPICQQCHANSRDVGMLGTLAQAAPYSITATDGNNPADNPRFQNFPHETANANLLVEPADDLCLNCHPADMLP